MTHESITLPSDNDPNAVSLSPQAGIASWAPTATRPPMEAQVARVVRQPEDKEHLTPRRDLDLRSALARGLAEYLRSWSVVQGGREHKLVSVFEAWPSSETNAVYPSAIVYTEGAVMYGGDDASLTGTPSASRFEGTKIAYTTMNVASTALTFEVWANSEPQRRALAAMVEDAFSPLDWMSGVKLELPYYHNVRAVYSLTDATWADNEDNNSRRYLRITYTVQARTSWIRVRGALPDFLPRAQLSVTEAAG